VPRAEMTESSAKRMVRLQRLGALLIVFLIMVAILLLRDRLVDYERYGYLGIFITTLLGSATVVLPVPGLAIVYLGGSIWNPLLVGLVAGLGDAMGEATGYLAGYAGQGLIENQSLYLRFEKWMRRNGFLTILILSAIPNPFFDLAGIAAGASGFPGRWFFLAAWIGKTIKDVTFALAGYYSISFFANLL
jgi:uncharacterized membrane protein YdjX (TVP38/TMEM64 family)